MPLSFRSELFALAIIVLVGCGLRLASLDRVAVEHFDEGVYASNVFFGPRENFHYPNQHLYAPPLVPLLIETVFQSWGPSNAGAMAVSLAAGCLTVPLLWWVGRRWFDPLTGLLAALLGATSALHVLLSRMCLVDALLGFLLLAAVALLTEGLERKSVLLTLAGGVTTGLAWWTKYNGWLPLAIVGGGLGWWMIRGVSTVADETPALAAGVGAGPRRAPGGNGWRIGLWVFAAAATAIVWSPVLQELQAKGGYAAVAANHRQYVVGWSGWGSSFLALLKSLEGNTLLEPLTIVRSVLVLFAWSVVQPEPFQWTGPGGASSPGQVLRVLAWSLVVGGLTAGLLAVLLLVALIGGASLARPRSLGQAAALVWLAGLLVVTPLYTPYPRIALPLLLAVWIVAASGLSRMLRGSAELQPELRWQGAGILAAAVAGLAIAPARPRLEPRGWDDRTVIVHIAKDIRQALVHETAGIQNSVVYVYGEPALLFQLRLLGIENVVPVEHLAFAKPNAARPTIPTFVITGPQADRTSGYPEQRKEADPRLTPVRRFFWKPSIAVRMDDRVRNSEAAILRLDVVE